MKKTHTLLLRVLALLVTLLVSSAAAAQSNGYGTASSAGGSTSVTGTGLWYSASGSLNAAAVGFSGDVVLGALSGGNVPTTIQSLVYTSAIPVTGPGFTFAAAQATPTIGQTTPGSVATPASITIAPQLPNGGSGTAAQNTPGSFIVNVGVPGAVGTAGSEAYLNVERGGSSLVALGALVGTTGSGAIYMGGVTPSAANYALSYTSGAGNVVLLNAPSSGHVRFQVNTVSYAELTGAYFGMGVPVGGFSGNNAFSWQSTSQALTSGASNVLAVTTYSSPHIKFTGTLSGAGTTVTFPATDGACWDLDFTAITGLSNVVTLIANSANWGTTITATASTQTPHICYSAGVARLVGTAMTQFLIPIDDEMLRAAPANDTTASVVNEAAGWR